MIESAVKKKTAANAQKGIDNPFGTAKVPPCFPKKERTTVFSLRKGERPCRKTVESPGKWRRKHRKEVKRPINKTIATEETKSVLNGIDKNGILANCAIVIGVVNTIAPVNGSKYRLTLPFVLRENRWPQ